MLNDFFTSVSDIDETGADLPQLIRKSDNTLVDITVTEADVKDVLNNLVINKACGPDMISHKMLKETASTVSYPLQLLFNKSLSACVYPASWKLAKVTPLFKKGDRSLPSNYRPISLISCVGKVMERVVFKYVYNHLHSNNLIYKLQSGFLPGHSTVYQLIDIYNQICKAFDEKKSTCMVFCDISKAFDRVWHSGLVFKLQHYGIEDKVKDWISHYLSHRSQRVIVGQSLSEVRNVNAGVPQGSVLGPLLFLIYVNDIADSLVSTTRLFADDSSLAVSSSDTSVIESTLNNDLKKISSWAKQWLVKFNPLKTEVMFFTLSNQIQPNIMFDGTLLNFVEHHKHLGLWLTDNGSWHEHISQMIKSASKLLRSMRLLKYKLGRKTLNQI